MRRRRLYTASNYARFLSGRLFGTHVTPDLSMQAVKLIILRFDDLIPEENDVVQTALKRLPPKEAYDRVFRIRRAFQVRLRLDPPEHQR